MTGRDMLAAGGASTNQQIITLLATEGGLFRIQELTARCCAVERDTKLFEGALLPFFQIITFPKVLSSLILEAPLDTIHNFLFGSGGRRGIDLFTFVAHNLADCSDDKGNSLATSLVACLGVLQKIIDLNGTAQVMDEFQPVVEVMSACLGDTTVEANLSVQTARQILSRIQARLGLGSSMPFKVNKSEPDSKSRAKFLLKQDLPGLLSSEGPRHDNDHENVSDISILPTAQEIQSHRLEYLPKMDQARLLGVTGLLDRHFRLLREDTVGQLRDAIRLEIERLRGVSGIDASPRLQQGTRTIVYHDVQLRDLTMDKRNGLQVTAEFDQPAVPGKANPKERSEWWEHSKQLQMDSLLCLVDSDGGTIFLSVCARNEKPQNQSEMPSESKASSDHVGKPDASKRGSEAANWRANGRANDNELTRNDFVQSGPPQGLSDNPRRAVITLRLAEPNERNLAQLQRRFVTGTKGPQSLVEFPGILLPSFGPTLKVLQQMNRRGDLPFSEFIASTTGTQGVINVPPPAYSLQPGFRFDLAAITNGEHLTLSPSEKFDFSALEQNSTLDDAQQTALVDALTRRLALIQGPPGTGKSFTGVALVKVLLQNREKAELGPLICVCYTNHALDQLLEHLLADGVEQIVRMGSRSKSEKLQDLNLRAIAQKADDTKTEKTTRYKCQRKLETDVEMIRGLLDDLKHSKSVSSVRAYLQTYHYQHYQELFGEDDDGWQTVHHRPENIISDWIRRGSFQHHRRTARQVGDLLEADLEKISATERECLYQHWVSDIANIHMENLMNLLESYRLTKEELDQCHRELDLRCLEQANVIGVTTSGLARNVDVLRRLPSKVLLCEEAGEVLEAHTLTALLPSIEHAILIGDHEQLRPQIQNYELQHDNPRGEKFSLDISLFERLVRPDEDGLQIPFSSLQTQRRMHPSIANLVRDTLYPHLLDYPAVSDYPNVLGLRKRRFWFDHQEPEAGADDSQPMSGSKSNDFEVEMTAALLSHLVRQGVYQSDDIAVLTPYLGQLQKLRKRLSSSFEIVVGDRDAEQLEKEGLEATSRSLEVSSTRKSTLLKALRLATVDNFQGEEAKVVVISLVRSNKAGNCGFLRTSNRINVLLSRARHGMYLIGNSQTYGHVPMWAKVLEILENDGDIGKSLGLCCPRHPDISIEVSTPDDFVRLAPEGGCKAKCTLRLSCGHSCVNKCHSEPLHNAVVCLEPCPRSMPKCDHPCSRRCGEPCKSKCEYPVSNVKLPCGHNMDKLDCWKAQDASSVYCKKKVNKVVPNCQHTVEVHCGKSVLEEGFECPATCDFQLSCGHQCQQQCKDCRRTINEVVERDHGNCTTLCGRSYTTCNHRCSQSCHPGEACPPCKEACEIQCSHSRCNKQCHEPCAPCAEACTWSCPHRGRCQLPCAVPCDLIPCSLRCQEVLTCGHQCPSLCGEKCPPAKYCQICAPRDVQEMMVDYILSSTYAEVDLDMEPCIIPSCGHIMTIESMDGHMGMSDHYIFAPDRSIADHKASSDPFTADLKGCPMCRAPLRDINRYGRIVRRGLLDESTKKFITWSNMQFFPLTERMHTEERLLSGQEIENDAPRQRSSGLHRKTIATAAVRSIHLQGSRADQVIAILNLGPETRKRYNSIRLLRKDISGFLRQVSETEQPFGRIYEMVTDLRRRRSLASTMEYPSNVLQVRNRLLATVLAIRCDFAILFDFLTFKRKVATRGLQLSGDWTTAELHLDFGANRKECENMIMEALARNQPMHEVEGRLYFARFTALERSNGEGTSTELLTEAEAHLGHARHVCEAHPGETAGMLSEITSVETMLHDGVFYSNVTTEEKRAIYAAMAREFQTTGHWYRCANGHPFTIGECGGAMEVTNCPVCGVAIGGRNHETVEGVTAAHDFDDMFGRLRV